MKPTLTRWLDGWPVVVVLVLLLALGPGASVGSGPGQVGGSTDLGQQGEPLAQAGPQPQVGQTYLVTLTEIGLPSGTSWSVTLNGTTNSSTTASITFSETNGTYNYTITPIAGYSTHLTGNLTVNGSAVSISVTFTLVTYTVTFSETGLPSGTNWSVTLGGSPESSTTSSIAFTEPNGTYPFIVGGVAGYTANLTSGSVVVNGASVSVSLTFAQVTYAVTFTETGLPSGTSWSVTLGGTSNSSTTTSIGFAEPNGTYSYSITPIAGYSTTYSGQVTVNGTSVAVSVTFTLVTYSVTFTETGLPSGTSWSVTLGGTSNSSTTTSIGFTEPNGTYAYSITPIAGYSTTYSGHVTVNGASVSESVTFIQVTYAVTFTETGLPSGTSWSVTLNGTTNSSTTPEINFTEPNGTYPYSIIPVVGYSTTYSGQVVVNGAPVTQPVTFTALPPGTYTVEFTETGLPSGMNWSVTIDQVIESSTSASIVFAEPNGTYPYSITPIPGYTTDYHGQLIVNGSAVLRNVTFARVTYLVTFVETDLPSGTNWSVTLNGTTLSSTTSSIVFAEPNGTYSFTVGSPIGYVADPATGQITVNGHPLGRSISYTPTSPSSPGTPLVALYVILGSVAGVVALGFVLLLGGPRRGRRRSS